MWSFSLHVMKSILERLEKGKQGFKRGLSLFPTDSSIAVLTTKIQITISNLWKEKIQNFSILQTTLIYREHFEKCFWDKFKPTLQ